MNPIHALNSLYIQMLINLMRCQVLTLLVHFLLESWVLYGVNLLPDLTYQPARRNALPPDLNFAKALGA